MLPFLVKTVICSGLLYGFYYLLLRKETFFHLNRSYLLAALLLSAIIPILHISLDLAISPTESFLYSLINGTKEFFFVYLLDEVVIYGKASPFSWFNIIEKVYFIGIFVFSIRIFIFLYQILKLHLASKKYKVGGISLYVHEKPYTAFSFWNIIYVNKQELLASHFRVIWKHEVQHIKYGHTVESFLLELWCSLFWFNPFVWAIKRKLKELHEYQTDSSLIRQGIDSVVYQQHLLNYTLAGRNFAAANNFAATALKNRIKMLAKTQSSIWRKAKFSFVVPIILLLFIAFATDFTTTNPPVPQTPPIPALDSISLNMESNIFE